MHSWQRPGQHRFGNARESRMQRATGGGTCNAANRTEGATIDQAVCSWASIGSFFATVFRTACSAGKRQ